MPKAKNKSKKTTYEYIVLLVSTTFTKLVPAPKEDLPEGVEDGFIKEWETTYSLFWPNKKAPEKLEAEDLPTVLNHLGEKGWKMITSDNLTSGIYVYEKYNNNEVSIPLERQFIFMRKK